MMTIIIIIMCRVLFAPHSCKVVRCCVDVRCIPQGTEPDCSFMLLPYLWFPVDVMCLQPGVVRCYRN